MNMDKQTIKAKWLEELRFGNHHQVAGTLKGIKSDGTIGYCCLGVLEEKVLGNQVTAVQLLDLHEDMGVEYEGPTSTYERLRDDVIGVHTLTDELVDMNDTGWTFSEIADYIEHNWNPIQKKLWSNYYANRKQSDCPLES